VFVPVSAIDFMTTYKMLLFLKRRPGMSPEEFRDYYENFHVPLAKKYSHGISRYFRRYLQPAPLTENGPGSDFAYDVVTEFWFEDEAVFRSTLDFLGTGMMAEEIIEDEKKLFDRAATRMTTVIECE
jgi:uncharacterized protein (TIGR02118 family)